MKILLDAYSIKLKQSKNVSFKARDITTMEQRLAQSGQFKEAADVRIKLKKQVREADEDFLKNCYKECHRVTNGMRNSKMSFRQIMGVHKDREVNKHANLQPIYSENSNHC